MIFHTAVPYKAVILHTLVQFARGTSHSCTTRHTASRASDSHVSSYGVYMLLISVLLSVCVCVYSSYIQKKVLLPLCERIHSSCCVNLICRREVRENCCWRQTKWYIRVKTTCPPDDADVVRCTDTVTRRSLCAAAEEPGKNRRLHWAAVLLYMCHT